ncbi:MAG: hypothetical protein K8R59_12210 [Thermoanaerobaculales bacterium]|nr:hypothetical protein [Thermoanaerobaculales bacterium]
MFVMVIAVMSIMMGVAVQAVSFKMQREREEELIFRGLQYVEAVRIYKIRYGRFPMRLKEIWEADPKVIRKKWKDPITDSENWGIIFLGQENQGTQRKQDIGLGTPPPTETPGMDRGRPGRSGGQGSGLPDGVHRSEDGELVGPIVGVHSTSCDESIKVYEGRTTYCEWRFFFREDRKGRGRGGGKPRPTRTPPGGFHGGDWDTPVPRSTGTPRP